MKVIWLLSFIRIYDEWDQQDQFVGAAETKDEAIQLIPYVLQWELSSPNCEAYRAQDEQHGGQWWLIKRDVGVYNKPGYFVEDGDNG